MRGEYYIYSPSALLGAELPPRARRIQCEGEDVPGESGTTSACAENTDSRIICPDIDGNYLRVRGEYTGAPGSGDQALELPPRARRIQEKLIKRAKNRGNYLRVRGEYSNRASSTVTCVELPPRARRIHVRLVGENNKVGTTSACAENTCSPRWGKQQGRNYLRVRGEYPHRCRTVATTAELPPRARRIPRGSLCTAQDFGTTSACAENTSCLNIPH